MHEPQALRMQALGMEGRDQSRELRGWVNEANASTAARELPGGPHERQKLAHTRARFRRRCSATAGLDVRRVADHELRFSLTHPRYVFDVCLHHLASVSPAVCVQVAPGHLGGCLVNFDEDDTPRRSK